MVRGRHGPDAFFPQHEWQGIVWVHTCIRVCGYGCCCESVCAARDKGAMCMAKRRVSTLDSAGVDVRESVRDEVAARAPSPDLPRVCLQTDSSDHFESLTPHWGGGGGTPAPHHTQECIDEIFTPKHAISIHQP
jgi:hypothetical protein